MADDTDLVPPNPLAEVRADEETLGSGEAAEAQREIDELEKEDKEWKKKSDSDREKSIGVIKSKIQDLEEEKVLFFQFSRQAFALSEKTRLGEEFTPEDELNAKRAIKTAYGATSFHDQMGIENAISKWAYSSIKDITNFLGADLSQTIAVAFSQVFYNIDYSSGFWEGVSNAYGQEAVWRSSILNRMYEKLVLLNTADSWFTQSPNAQRLKELRKLKEQADKEKDEASHQAEQAVHRQTAPQVQPPSAPAPVPPEQGTTPLATLETIAQDQAARRNISIEQARQLVWETTRTYAAELDVNGFEIKQGSTPITIVNQALSRVGIKQDAKLVSPEDKTVEFSAHMDEIVQRAENRPFDLRREPDRVLWEQMRNTYQQIFRQNPKYESFQEEIEFLAWTNVGTPDYKSDFDDYRPTYQTRRSDYSKVASWARQYAQDYAIKGAKAGVKKIGGKIIKKTGQVAAQETATAATVAGSKILTKVAAWVGTRLGVNIVPVLGQVLSIAFIVKDVLDLIKSGVSGLFKSFSKSVLPEYKSKAQIYAKKGFDLGGIITTVGTVSGAIIGAVVGTAIGGPIGTVIGAIIGAVIGWAIGSLFGWLVKSDPEDDRDHGVGFDKNANRKLGLAILAIMGGAPSAGFVATILIIIFLISLFFPQSQDQVKKLSFKAEVAAEPSIVSLEDFKNAGDTTTIAYTITIKAQTTPVLINSVDYKITGQNSAGTQILDSQRPVTIPTIVQPGTPLVLSGYSFVATGKPFEDSKIINTVTAIGTEMDALELETETSSVMVRIGEPPSQQPYGYPAEGAVTSFDLEPIKYRCKLPGGLYTDTQSDGTCKIGVKKRIVHCGTFLTLFGTQCIAGGMDIAKAGGNAPVYSTLDGVVIKSGFDLGPASATCVPVAIPAANIYTFCYPALAGYVYVKSDDGRYIAAYLHLTNDGLVAQNLSELNGVRVTRGQEIGKTFTGKICDSQGRCTSTGPHLHYQILLDRANVEFNNSNNWGKCSDGKILPSDSASPATSPHYGMSPTKGPFECD